MFFPVTIKQLTIKFLIQEEVKATAEQGRKVMENQVMRRTFEEGSGFCSFFLGFCFLPRGLLTFPAMKESKPKGPAPLPNDMLMDAAHAAKGLNETFVDGEDA